MPKGYWVARIDVADMDAYKAYVAANAQPFAQYGARFLVIVEGYDGPQPGA